MGGSVEHFVRGSPATTAATTYHLLPSFPFLSSTTSTCCPPTNSSVRIFEAIKDKSPDDATYQYVVGQLAPVVEELGLSTPESLGL